MAILWMGRYVTAGIGSTAVLHMEDVCYRVFCDISFGRGMSCTVCRSSCTLLCITVMCGDCSMHVYCRRKWSGRVGVQS